MTKREQQVLALIKADPLLSQQEIAKSIGISRSSVAGHIMNLVTKGFIKGRGYVFNDAPYVAVIGGTNMDIHGSPQKKLRMHDSNPGAVNTSPGGVARNIAENLARLGADSRLVSAVGNDPYGKMLMQHSREAGIDVRHVDTLDSAPTSTYISILDNAGDMHVGLSDMTIMNELGPDRLRACEAMLKQAALVIIDTNLSDDALAWLAARSGDTVLFVDTVSTTKAHKIKPYLQAVHTLKPGLIEAEALSGIKTTSIRQLPKLANWFHEQGVNRIFISLGPKGVFYSTIAQHGIAKPQNDDSAIKNAGGAGDAFLAGIAYSWLQDWELEKSVRFGLAAANITMLHSMTNNPDLSLATVNRMIENLHVK